MPPTSVLLALATACFSGGCLAVVPPSPQVSFSLVKWPARQDELTNKMSMSFTGSRWRSEGEGREIV